MNDQTEAPTMTFYEYIAKAMTRMPDISKELKGLNGNPLGDMMSQHLEHSTLQEIFDSNVHQFLSLTGEHPIYTLSYEEDAVTPKFEWAVHEKEFWDAACRFVLDAKLRKMGLGL